MYLRDIHNYIILHHCQYTNFSSSVPSSLLCHHRRFRHTDTINKGVLWCIP